MHYTMESVSELKTVINATKNPNDSVSDKAIHIKFYDNEKYVGEVYLSSIDTDNVFVYNLEVSKPLRGQGYGRAIMNHILTNYPIGELMYEDVKYPVTGGKIGEVIQMLYYTLTGIQWGVLDDTFGWTYKI